MTFYTDAELIYTYGLHYANRDAILAWLVANGLDPNLVRSAKAGRLYIRVEEYVVNDDGQKQLDPRRRSRAWTRTRRVPMRVSPPTLERGS